VHAKRTRTSAEARSAGLRGGARHSLFQPPPVDDSAVLQALDDVLEGLVAHVERSGRPEGFASLNTFFAWREVRPEPARAVGVPRPALLAAIDAPPFTSAEFDLGRSFEVLLGRTLRSDQALVRWLGHELARALVDSPLLALCIVRVVCRHFGGWRQRPGADGGAGAAGTVPHAPVASDDFDLLSQALAGAEDVRAAGAELIQGEDSVLVLACVRALEAGHDDSKVVARAVACVEGLWKEFARGSGGDLDVALRAGTMIAGLAADAAKVRLGGGE
jgi:hypothetical protein